LVDRLSIAVFLPEERAIFVQIGGSLKVSFPVDEFQFIYWRTIIVVDNVGINVFVVIFPILTSALHSLA